MYPDSIASGVNAYYVKAPADPRWGYSLGSAGQYLYDSTIYGATLLNNGGVLSSYTGLGVTGVVNTYPNVAYTGGTGTGLVIDADVTTTSAVTFTIVTPGINYVVGDQIVVTAGELGGGSTAVTITLTAADFNSDSTYGSTQFELHPSEQTNIILNILMYSGIIIRDPQIVQTAAKLIQQDETVEKQ